tara:strand:- start:306 stop:479 length:174 start_codon:yes stop_codon:yes gene_type:complete
MKCFHCDGDTTKLEHEDFDERFDEKYTRLTKVICTNCGAFYNVFLPTDKKYLAQEED